MTTEIYEVTVDRPAGVTVEEMRSYIEEAVSIWKGQMDPDCPMFDMNTKPIKAKRQPAGLFRTKDAMIKMGRKGGRNRAESLSPERRKEIASKAAKARWGKRSLQAR